MLAPFQAGRNDNSEVFFGRDSFQFFVIENQRAGVVFREEEEVTLIGVENHIVQVAPHFQES